ncbi:MAG: hypothetical protein EAX81_06920 [Candidatus Thorarchaeota archaeon]|nr:hypothetical protein [Candidatus Thorarchaeota archaeon]
MIAKDSFEPTTERGWRMGFTVLMKKELKAWFGSPFWWQQGLLWSLILGMFGSVGISDPDTGLAIFYMMATIFPSIATIIISHETILEEKRSGSAAWVLSKPVSREAFIIPKFLGLSLGVSFSMVLFPGLAVYLETLLLGLPPNFLIYLLSLVPMALWQMFLVFLTLCAGTFFDDPGPVMAVPFLFIFIGINLGQHPDLGQFGPWGLLQVSLSLVGEDIYSITPVVTSLLVLAVLMLLAIWRFRRHEF